MAEPATATTGPLTEEELRDRAESLGRAAAREGVFVALFGPLGSGKTTFVQAACRGAGVEEPVRSPTYTLVHGYRGPRGARVHHADLYRLSGEEELREMGWELLLEAGERGEPVFVEWADRAGSRLPADRWDVHLAFADRDDRRRMRVERRGAAPSPLPLDARP